MAKIAIILTSAVSLPLAETICREWKEGVIYGIKDADIGELFASYKALVFIGAMGICVRGIAPFVKDKYTDPAVVNVDSTGRYVVPVLSGHIGGANDLAKQIARITGGEAVVTTQSDLQGLWALDTIGQPYNWQPETTMLSMNEVIALFVKEVPTALLLDIQDEGTRYLERTVPAHVDVYYRAGDMECSRYELIIGVTPRIYQAAIPVLYYRPPVLHLGVGCRKDCDPSGVDGYIRSELSANRLSVLSVKDISTIDIKAQEPLVKELQDSFGVPCYVYTAGELEGIEVPNPSEKVQEVVSVPGVSEAVAIKSAGGGTLLLEKQKGAISKGNEFTFAVAIDKWVQRGDGHIEIVGAGPGDPKLVSVRGKEFLEMADLILYAGSLVPVELTYYAKPGAVVRSSASMTLEEQFELMRSFYDKGCLVVRLHTGDPCIYGAIQEQMAFFDQYDMSYHITPGISSFQAAAAALQSQFTIPEKVQTIILTRGEGRTPVPEKERLSLLARSQSTMCIFLSAGVVEEVQKELLEHYPPATPVAACYKLTWRDECIYRGELKDLVSLVKDNNLTLTTMIVVGEAIDNRKGLSRLYAGEFGHLFREAAARGVPDIAEGNADDADSADSADLRR